MTTSTSTQNLEAMLKSIALANARWAQKTRVQDGTISPDLQRGIKFIDAQSMNNAVSLMGVEKAPKFFNLVAQSLGNKAIMRCCEFFACISAKNYRKLDGVTALELLSAGYAGADSRSAVFFAATGKGDESTSDEVKGIAMVRKLQKVLKMVASGTESTQNSRSFGIHGFARALDMGYMQCDASGTKRLHVVKGNPFTQAVKRMIESASEQTLATMRGASED